MGEVHRLCDGRESNSGRHALRISINDYNPDRMASTSSIAQFTSFMPWAQISSVASEEGAEELQAPVSSYVIFAGKFKETR